VKSPYVSELAPNQMVNGTFLVQNKDIRQKKTGEPYLALLLTDRTGGLDAKMWDNAADVMESFQRNDFVHVRGYVQIHQNRPQLTIHKLAKTEEGAVDFTDYFPASNRGSQEMFDELHQIVAGLKNPHLKSLLESILADEQIARPYRTSPAAKQIHHAWLGGLIEHVISLCRLCRTAAEHYGVDGDLLLAGAILHDIGKIHELVYDRAFGYSDEGQLLGHIVIGLRLVDDKIRELPDFPPRLRTLVEHMILSHHGQLEFGSPKVPLFLEAMLLHHLDNMDSKMEAMRAAVARDRQVGGCWTSLSPALDRMVLKKDRYLDGPPDPPEAKPAGPQAPSSEPTSFGQRLQNALGKDR